MFGCYSGILFPTVLQLLIHWRTGNVIHDIKSTKFTTCFLNIYIYIYYNMTLNIATCFSSQGTICAYFQIKYIGSFQDSLYQDPAHLCNTVHRNVIHFNNLTLLQHISCVQKWLIWLYVLLLWFVSLMMVPCRLKRVGRFSVIL
jgi:hypothetical protein